MNKRESRANLAGLSPDRETVTLHAGAGQVKVTEAEFNDRMDRGCEHGWVYFIQAGTAGPIKVGWSVAPETRIRELQTGQPETLKMLGVVPGSKLVERDIHRRLADFRLSRRGEWFQPQALSRCRGYIEAAGLKMVFKPADLPSYRRGRHSGDFLITIDG